MFRDRAHKLHFVGIGGVGMSGIAEVLLNLGYDVSGSDMQLSPATSRLAALGAKVFRGHLAENVAGRDVVVISTAIQEGNPEIVEAKKQGIPIIRRAEMLAELMRMKYGIAVAGTHGKTTTTSLVATALSLGDIDPTIVIGGKLRSIHSNAKLGAGDYMVAEADESDGSFLKLIPTIAVITNIDAEHLDYWTGGLEQIVDAFVDFSNKVPFYGCSIVCVDHPVVQTILPRLEKRYVTYGFSAQADFVAEDVEVLEGAMAFSVRCRGELQGRIHLNMIGRHNILNALAAVVVAEEVGVPFETIAESLSEFSGVGRRFEVKGCVQDILVVDDYGHHPEEIVATLSAAREAYDRRLVVAFQPHRYTRTQSLLKDFSRAFNASHVLLVSDIYAAGEDPIIGVDAQSLVASISEHGHHDAQWVGPVEAMGARLEEIVRPGDLVLTLGAGNVWQAGEELLVYLRGGLSATTSPSVDEMLSPSEEEEC
ncbi:MAG: UDP-N-acetylmuramate--L-alanine ligase [Myxococcota bacterium]|jgi:UDP-N-acetylmuramate--alanine ligase|nr:UDP-N-acetylmuramate--L-alanine ligase [Myxococcota bacterium]